MQHTLRISVSRRPQTGGVVAIRTAPNTDGKILGVAHRGDTLPYGGQVSEGGWLLVQHKNQNAWVSGKYGKLD